MFEKISDSLNLGDILSEPKRLFGGYLHQMYAVHTTTGKYAIKLLNPSVMSRKDALINFKRADEFEKKLEKHSISMLYALNYHGQKIQKIEEEYYYVYPYFEGKSLKGKKLTKVHCMKIGHELAKIHLIEELEMDTHRDELLIDWNQYIKLLEGKEIELYEKILESKNLLFDMQTIGNLAIKRLPKTMTICHNDLDPKNVLWQGLEFKIIDLECLNYSSPYLELLETALCFAGFDCLDLNYDLLKSFVLSYKEAGGHLPNDWCDIYNANINRLEWLEYNLCRVLEDDEKELSVSQVKLTLAQIHYYQAIKNNVLNVLEEIR